MQFLSAVREKWRSFFIGKSKSKVVIVGAAALIVSSSVLAAGNSFLNQDGTYTGCVSNNGSLRVLAPGDSCKSNETQISWNQTGPQGLKGDTGLPGPKGDIGAQGPAGSVTLASLSGTSCTRANGEAGTVAFKVNADDTIALSCQGSNAWCVANTPQVGPHMNAICNNDAHTISYACDPGWIDANGNPVDGCEENAGGGVLAPISYSGVAANYLSMSGLMFSGTDTFSVPGDCGSNLDAACPGGVESNPLPTMTADMIQRSGDTPRVEASSDQADSRYNMTARFRLKTNTAIPVTLPGGAQCGLSIDTTHGSSPDLVVNFQDNVVNPDGPTVVGTTTVSGLEAADFSISGDVLCGIENITVADILPSLQYELTPWIDERGVICGAPDPFYFQRCLAN